MTWFFAAIRHAFTSLWGNVWTFALPIATLLLFASIYAVRLPDTYQARALVRVREMTTGDYGSRLPTEEGARAFETVSTVRDRLITMKTLRTILPILAPTLAPEDAVGLEKLKDRIEFNRMSDYSFSIAVSGEDPEAASKATNKLLETFFEEERAPLLRRARDRRAFYDHEVASATEVQVAASRALDTYRTAHHDVLPELKDVVTNELTALRAEARVQTQLSASARRRAEFLSEQIARNGITSPTSVPTLTASADEKRLDQQLVQQQTLLGAARKRLADARTRHTEKMPDVIRLRNEVSGLTADVRATVAALQAARQAALQRSRASTTRLEKEKSAQALSLLRELRTGSLAEAKQAVEMGVTLRSRILALEIRLAKIPATAAALSPLLERLEQANRRRDALQGSASAAAEREGYLLRSAAQDVTPYQVAQWAVPPAKPKGPRRVAILLTAMAVGTLLGYGLMLLRRRFKEQVVASADQLRPLLPEAMIVSVPWIETDARHHRRLPWQALIPATWVVACLGLTVWTLAAHRGYVAAPPWLEMLIGRSV